MRRRPEWISVNKTYTLVHCAGGGVVLCVQGVPVDASPPVAFKLGRMFVFSGIPEFLQAQALLFSCEEGRIVQHGGVAVVEFVRRVPLSHFAGHDVEVRLQSTEVQ